MKRILTGALAVLMLAGCQGNGIQAEEPSGSNMQSIISEGTPESREDFAGEPVPMLSGISEPEVEKVLLRIRQSSKRLLTYSDEGFSDVLAGVQALQVDPDSMRQVPPQTKLEHPVQVRITFQDGQRYDLSINEEQLLIFEKGDDHAALYQTAQPFYKEWVLQQIGDEMCGDDWEAGKPVIYLYPEQPTDVSVRLDYQGKFTYTYPAYNDGWQVTAYPDGRLVNKADGSEHYYLFWEGSGQSDWDFSSGFCVPGPETEGFLRKVLPQTGLLPREYNDFITYWVPRMQHNRYNLIHFAGEPYERLAPLTVTPSPDAILRVHMVYRPLASPVELPPQTFEPFERNGFTVVEWGGSSIRAKSD